MRKWLSTRIIIVLVLILCTATAGCTGGSLTKSTSGPEGTIRAFYRQAENLDASKLVDLLVKEQRVNAAAAMAMIFATMDSLSISNLKVTVTSQTKDTAEVTAEYDYKYKLKDDTTEAEHDVAHFELRRADDKWLIKDSTNFLFQ